MFEIYIMESFIQDLRIDGKTVEWEDRTVKLLQSKGITSIAQLFDAAQINVTPTLENKFNVGYGMSLNMNVYFLFDLIRDIGSIDRLCAPVAGPEKEEHETRAVAEPSCTPRTVHITRPLVKTKIDQPIPQ